MYGITLQNDNTKTKTKMNRIKQINVNILNPVIGVGVSKVTVKTHINGKLVGVLDAYLIILPLLQFTVYLNQK
jgi:hypothetical protein